MRLCKPPIFRCHFQTPGRPNYSPMLGSNASESRAGKERFKSNVWEMLGGLLSLLILSCRSHASCCEKLDIKHTDGLCLSLIRNMTEPDSKLPRAFIQSPGEQRDSVMR
jgi:hypothetical protein